MKRIICVVLTIICIAALMTGCGEKTTAGTVSTDGSTSMEKVINTLGESFMNQHSGVTFTYNPTGSGTGITAVKECRCDFGLTSRDLKE